MHARKYRLGYERDAAAFSFTGPSRGGAVHVRVLGNSGNLKGSVAVKQRKSSV